MRLPSFARSPWLLFALVLLVAPWVFPGSLGLAILSQIAIAIVACLSFNLLLGQGGMLSFGHAVYTGLGAYAAIHAMKALVVPVVLVPLAGGAGGLAAALVFGFLSTRKAGTAFAMITLGIGELVYAAALMFPDWFGGEAGIAVNRAAGAPFLGLSFGPALQVYYLLAVYTLACAGALYGFTRTPLGRVLDAVRDNPERAEFLGHDTRHVRFLVFLAAGFFAGVAGGMAAVHFEIATPEVLGPARSGAYLLFTFLGGTRVFFGPIIGAVLMVLSLRLLSEFTAAWLLYLGLAFIAMVLYAPGGIASLLLANARSARVVRGRDLWVGSLALLAIGAVVLVGAAGLVEMAYRFHAEAVLGARLQFLGATLDAGSVDAWVGAVFVLVTALGLFELARRHHRRQWRALQQEDDAS